MVELDPAPMTRRESPAPPCAPSAASTDATEALGLELGRLGRITHLLKARNAGFGPPGLDHAAFAVLMTLFKGGPRRQGELADATLLDPSTISRHIAQLVKAGLVERRPDPSDGRAVQLVASAAGEAFGNELIARRRAMIEDALGSWSGQDVETLAGLLRRFNDAMETSRDLIGRSGPPGPADAPHRTQQTEQPRTQQNPHYGTSESQEN